MRRREEVEEGERELLSYTLLINLLPGKLYPKTNANFFKRNFVICLITSTQFEKKRKEKKTNQTWEKDPLAP